MSGVNTSGCSMTIRPLFLTTLPRPQPARARLKARVPEAEALPFKVRQPGLGPVQLHEGPHQRLRLAPPQLYEPARAHVQKAQVLHRAVLLIHTRQRKQLAACEFRTIFVWGWHEVEWPL